MVDLVLSEVSRLTLTFAFAEHLAHPRQRCILRAQRDRGKRKEVVDTN